MWVCCSLLCVPKLCNDVDDHYNQGYSDRNLHVQTHHTRGKLYESFAEKGTVSDDTLRASFFAEAIPNFWLPWKYLPPHPLPLTKSHISPVSAFPSKVKPSLLACSAATSLPATLLHTARPRLSRQVIHTRPPSSSSSFHIPHAPTTGASAAPSTQITEPSTR